MVAEKTKWSLLILEDNPRLREALRTNLKDLLGDSLHFEFAASICQAICKVKSRMRDGLPFDAFLVDLVLDYFTYDDTGGEIIAVHTLGDFLNTSAFMMEHGLETLSPFHLARSLALDVFPDTKPLQSYSDREKLLLLDRLTHYCLSEVEESYRTYIELLKKYFKFSEHSEDRFFKENTFARDSLEFLFRKVSGWVENQEEQYSFHAQNLSEWTNGEGKIGSGTDPDKCSYSWTIFIDWVREFYNMIALGEQEHAGFTSRNKLLYELKKVAPREYPVFLVNTAYAGKREHLLKVAAIYDTDNIIVSQNEFKGSLKDAALIKYISGVCSRLRSPYFQLKGPRREFLLSNECAPDMLADTSKNDPQRLILEQKELGLKLTMRHFYPDLAERFYKVRDLRTSHIQDIQARLSREYELQMVRRVPAAIKEIQLYVPEAFYIEDGAKPKFLLYLSGINGAERDSEFSNDEGRWLLLELACRRFFPKCFYIHSQWKAQQTLGETAVYFPTSDDVLRKAIQHAAIDHPEYFPEFRNGQVPKLHLAETPAFYQHESFFRSCFEWDSLFGPFASPPAAAADQPGISRLQNSALRLLFIAREMMLELKIRKVCQKFISKPDLNAESLLSLIPGTGYLVTDDYVNSMARTISSQENATLLKEQLIPSIENLIAITLCFFTIPSPQVENFYNFWLGKNIPPTGTRPTEKFSTISEKIDTFDFKKSLQLPLIPEGKNNFLFISAALRRENTRIFVTTANERREITAPQELVTL